MPAIILTPKEWATNLITDLNAVDNAEYDPLHVYDVDLLETLGDATACFLFWSYKAQGDPGRQITLAGEIIQGFHLFDLDSGILYHRWVRLYRFHQATLECVGHPDILSHIDPIIQRYNDAWHLMGWSVYLKEN